MESFNVNQLKKFLDSLSQDHLEDNLIITTADGSIGARAGVGIQIVHCGFDWESGQIRIEPEEALVRDRTSRDKPKDIISWRDGYFCPKCQGSLTKKEVKNSHYCSCCGQRLSGKAKEVKLND